LEASISPPNVTTQSGIPLEEDWAEKPAFQG